MINTASITDDWGELPDTGTPEQFFSNATRAEVRVAIAFWGRTATAKVTTGGTSGPFTTVAAGLYYTTLVVPVGGNLSGFSDTPGNIKRFKVINVLP